MRERKGGRRKQVEKERKRRRGGGVEGGMSVEGREKKIVFEVRRSGGRSVRSSY